MNIDRLIKPDEHKPERERVILHLKNRRQFLTEEYAYDAIESAAYHSMLDYFNLLESLASKVSEDDLGKIVSNVEKIANGRLFALIDVKDCSYYEVTELTISELLPEIAKQLQKVMMVPVGIEDLEIIADEVEVFEYLSDKSEHIIDFEVVTDQPYKIDLNQNVLKGSWRIAITTMTAKKFMLSAFPVVKDSNFRNFQLEVDFIQDYVQPGIIRLRLMAKSRKKSELIDTDPIGFKIIARWEPKINGFYTMLDKDDSEDDLYA